MIRQRRRRFFFSIFLWTLVTSCGSSSSVGEIHTPLILRIDPDTGGSGEVVTVYGSGFSEEEDNVLFIGGQAIVGTDWDLADTGIDGEVEQISVTLPDGLLAGEQDVFVMVGSETSNSVSFTVAE